MLRSLIPPLNVVLRYPWVPGFRVRLNLRRHLAYWKRGLAGYEPHVARLLQAVVSPADDVVEVGTHIGFFTILLASRARSVLALEPDAANLQWTRRNLKLNDILNARLLPFAAGDREGREAFCADRATGSMGHLDPEVRDPRAIQVDVVRLDHHLRDFLGARVPSLIKIDAEGAEDRVLEGMGALLEGETRILVEVGEKTRQDVHERLHRHGYRLYNPFARAWQPPGTWAGWHVYATKRAEPTIPLP